MLQLATNTAEYEKSVFVLGAVLVSDDKVLDCPVHWIGVFMSPRLRIRAWQQQAMHNAISGNLACLIVVYYVVLPVRAIAGSSSKQCAVGQPSNTVSRLYAACPI